jgi:predicted transcriptional regulator
LIADSEKIPKLTQKELSEKYGIGRTTVSDILKKKDFFTHHYTTIMQEIRKGLRFHQNTRN